ncbi:Transmembrane protein [Ceratobasidium theobromae]|uniref:Transmembrane protein n=1 Tax=Ceratobasidium theobromae TaxID=1582974 RepID=A0A5N5QFR6_9AGAM|nr:Transmembrane protein [Ceratobasidium theobromae]
MLHLPLLLCVVLLLVAIKNQFLLTSIISTAFGENGGVNGCYMAIYEIFSGKSTTDIKTNQAIVDAFIRYRITWSKEYDELMGLVTKNGTIPFKPDSTTNEQFIQVFAWYMRTSLEVVKHVFENFMGGKDNIPSEIQKKIDDYKQISTRSQLDYDWVSGSGSGSGSDSLATILPLYDEIITDLLRGNIEGARYITALAGSILILLAGLNLAQAKLRPRFKYGAIISRVLMGLILISLLLLNLGRKQSLWATTTDQPLVFRWIFSYWVLPTIATAYGVEFLIEAVPAWLNAVDTERAATATRESLGRMAWRSIAHAFKRLNIFA